MGDLAGQPNYFISKIWMKHTFSPVNHVKQVIHGNYYQKHVRQLGQPWDIPDNPIHPKLHTIRHDPQNRWKPGTNIHFVINNRTKKRFQFAPVIPCMSIQKIEIKYESDWKAVFIDDWLFYEENELYYTQREAMNTFALNDGFPTVDAFFSYFNQNFNGKLIHFTDLKY